MAYLVKEVEGTEVAWAIREVANEQFNKVTKDLREFAEGLKEKVKEDLGEKMALLEKKTVELSEVVEKAAQQAGSAGGAPYRDALIWAVSGAPLDANPQLAAKESIQQRQSLIDLPKGSRLRECANMVLVGKFSEAMGKATAQKHKIRSALKLQNGGILVEMVTDEGVAGSGMAGNQNQRRGLPAGVRGVRGLLQDKVIQCHRLLRAVKPRYWQQEGQEGDRGDEWHARGCLLKVRWIKPPA